MRRRGLGRAGRSSLVGTAARTAVVVGTASAVSGSVAAGQQAKAEQAAAQQAAPQQPVAVPPPPASPPSLSDEVVDQLKKLAELKEAGIVSEDEFVAKKAQLLDL